MPDTNKKDIEEKLSQLRKSYFISLPDKIGHITQLWQKILHAQAGHDPLKDLQYAVHTLSGSGASFGAVTLSRLARSMDELLLQIIQQERLPDAAEQQELSQLVQQLEQAASMFLPAAEEAGLSAGDKTRHQESLIYILEHDTELAGQLAAKLAAEQYTVRCFADPGAFKEACRSQRPQAVVVEIVFAEAEAGDDGVTRDVTQLCQPPPALIFISERHDIATRLAAVRAGASHYFSKPLELDRLLHTLAGLGYQSPHAPYRVLIVDDDAELAEYYAALLQGAGMLTRILTDPLQVLEVLEDWQPDLVMLDIYMPVCNGLELASIIRQDDQYTSLPLLFLSSETDADKQLHALDLGGEVFLTKPVESQQLLSTVIARVKRSRRLIRLKQELEMSLQKNEIQRKEIEKKEERLRFSQYFANLGTWDLNLQTREMYWSEKIAPLLGYQTEAFKPSYDAFLAAIHPDDKQNVIAAIEACSNRNADYEIEHRVMLPDGSVRWLLQKGDVIRDANDQPVRMLGVVQDTTRRKRLERDLATQKEFAVQANSAKSEFLSRMSHELRTPLNAIIGFAQLLESDTQQPLSAHQYDSLDEILKAGNHLLELIDEVLDLAKIESGKIQLHIEHMPVVDVLLESYSMMIPMAENNHIQLDFHIEQCEQMMINADRTKLKQVLFNLMSNAIKYNRANGQVCVSCEDCGGQRLRISVTDTGPGIPSERQPELFKAFNRLGAEHSDVEGTGIGLMISKKLVEMMGGELGFHSEPDKGSVFWVEISSLHDTAGDHRGDARLGHPR